MLRYYIIARKPQFTVVIRKEVNESKQKYDSASSGPEYCMAWVGGIGIHSLHYSNTPCENVYRRL